MQHHPHFLTTALAEVGIEQKFKGARYAQLISGANIPELSSTTSTPTSYTFGACAPLTDVSKFCEADEGAVPQAFHNMLRWFASTQIRNTASLAGNLATASPISDMNPMLAASDAVMTVRSERAGERSIKVSEFFLAYRKTALAADEIIVSVTVPKAQQYVRYQAIPSAAVLTPLPLARYEYILPFKQAKRREDDISIVTAGIRVRLAPAPDSSGWIVTDSGFGWGGMAARTVGAPLTSAFLLNKPWTAETITAARAKLAEDLPLPDSVPGGQPEYVVQ